MSTLPAPGPLDLAIAEIAETLAHAWVDGLKSELARDGRKMTGGWPGTLGEAKMRALRGLPRELAQRGLAQPLVPADYDRASKALYAVARKAWLGAAEPDDP
jgi:hypothetical protein